MRDDIRSSTSSSSAVRWSTNRRRTERRWCGAACPRLRNLALYQRAGYRPTHESGGAVRLVKELRTEGPGRTHGRAAVLSLATLPSGAGRPD